MQKTTTRASDEAGVHRAPDGKRWEAYVLPGKRLIKLGTYDTKAQAIAARRKYWAEREAKGR